MIQQAINYNHLMPTRYVLELDSLKGAVSQDTLKEDSQKVDAKKNVKKVFEQKYAAGQNKWFFQSLRWDYTLSDWIREKRRADLEFVPPADSKRLLVTFTFYFSEQCNLLSLFLNPCFLSE